MEGFLENYQENFTNQLKKEKEKKLVERRRREGLVLNISLVCKNGECDERYKEEREDHKGSVRERKRGTEREYNNVDSDVGQEENNYIGESMEQALMF